MNLPVDPTVYLAPLALLTLTASFVQIRLNQKDLSRRKREIDQKIYETLILREIGERIGYELNLEKVLETIASSLNKLIPFSVIGYLLLDPESSQGKTRFHLEESVSRLFLNDFRDQVLARFNHDTGLNLLTEGLAETITGTIVDDSVKVRLSSVWLVPLIINNHCVGVLGVGSKKSGLYQPAEMEILDKILAQANRAVSNLERVLASEEEKLNSMVASMADGILMLDGNLNLVVINPTAAVLLGLPADKKLTMFEVVKSLADKLDLRVKIEESTKINQLVAVDNLQFGEKISRLLISPVKDAGGRFLGTVVLFHDLTAQKELERLREEFTAMMVHELRAPLTVVRGATDMFLRNPALSGQQSGQDLLKTVQNSASSMLSLVNDLLDAAKIEAGKFQLVKTTVNLTEIVRDRVLFFSQLTAPKSINLVTENLEENLTIAGDRERLAQILNNLLSNAIKFAPVGGKIWVSGYKIATINDVKWRFNDAAVANEPSDIPSGVLISVSDTGVGIPPDKIGDLFSKFHQLHLSDSLQSTGVKGTGLGLAIAKGIVESHGGQIFVQSKINEGTTFYFTIPES